MLYINMVEATKSEYNMEIFNYCSEVILKSDFSQRLVCANDSIRNIKYNL